VARRGLDELLEDLWQHVRREVEVEREFEPAPEEWRP
jgi:hypothetical protein